MTRSTRSRITAVSAVAAAFLALIPSTANAAPDSTPTPVWSGLDARNYRGPIGTPGTLISKTPLDRSISLPRAGAAYRVLYASTDFHNRPAVSTGAIFLPKTPAPKGGYPVIAWAHGTTGLGDNCAPSALPRSDRDRTYLDHWLSEGYAIVSTDYVGLGTPGLMNYLSSEVQAHSIVDSVIAASRAGLSLSRKWAIVGQSQGAGAALNGARRATALSRGTGLDYRGVVATGTPANIEHIVWQAGPGIPPIALPDALTAYGAYIWAGFTAARPDLHPESILTPAGRRAVSAARTQCYSELATTVHGQRFGDWFAKPISSIPEVKAALVAYMSVPYSGYDRPIFLGQGLVDTDVPAPSALSLYAQLRANNQPVELHVYPGEDHSGTVLASMKDSTPFVARIMR